MRSVAALGVQRAASAALAFVASILLARLLTPHDLGTYAILSYVLLVAATVAELALGKALIQQAAEPSPDELRAAFTLQLLGAAAVAALCALLAPALARAYALGPDGAGLLAVLLASLAAAPFRLTATLRLERAVSFRRVALADLAEQATFSATAVALAWRGLGAWALAWGFVAGRAAGLLALAGPLPALPGLGLSRAAASLVRRGATLQLGSLVVLVRDAVSPVFLGLWAGTTGVGYLQWAVGLVFLPLAGVQVASRVLFPAFARRQGDVPALRTGLQHSLDLALMGLCPWAFACLVLREPLADFVFGPQWRPAVPAVVWLAPSAVLGGAANLLLGFLNGVGQARSAVAILLLWTGIFWALGVPGAAAFGFVGVAAASGLASLVVAAAQYQVRRVVPVRLWDRCLRWAAAGLVLWVPARWLAAQPAGWLGTLAAMAGVGLAHVLLGAWMAGPDTRTAAALFLRDLAGARGENRGSARPVGAA